MKMRKFILITLLCALVVFGCDDKEETDDPKQDRSDTVKIFGGISTVTIKVMGMTTKAEWDDIANKIAGRLNAKFATYNEEQQDACKEIFGRGVIYIVEANPEGYSNCKTIGDGKTVYIALDKIDSPYVEDAIPVLYQYGNAVAQKVPDTEFA